MEPTYTPFPDPEVELKETFSKPGTADVTPRDKEKLKSLLKHYCPMPHTFTTCKRDQVKHGVPEAHANRRCAVIKMLCGKKVGGRNS